MKPIQSFKSSLLVLLAAFWSVTAMANQESARIMVSDVGFATPESVEYDAAEDVYLVSNINGSPFEADDNGFISKLSPEGKVIDLKWIDGASDNVQLHAPKGMTIIGNKLFVADITQIRVFELPSGKQLPSINVQGSSFLNGITAGNGDYVYVSDTGMKPGFKSSGTDAIYKVWENGKVETILKDPNMGRPNGILNDNGDIYVVFFSTAKMIKMDEKGHITEMPKPFGARLDGLVKLPDGSLAMSSWESSSIDVYKNGEYETIAEFLNSPADMGVDTKRNRLLIPLFNEDKVLILPL
ncbi:periplasmic ATP/GTP-binding protein [Hydrogenovibrio crunogenus]|uniref:Periplasmic ATP/GTP-binding protein n=2 Tax=Hydrogenovibrio crunogenus TaxID=39765 RepID=A0A4P7NZB8_9GAMM|nr:periplasmic ATP/GTP-binding protein [Hydrogenovibrio crunogenus]